MKEFVVVMGVLGLLGSIAVGTFMAMGGTGGVDYETMTGKEIYGKLCQQCHGDRGTAPNGAGNSYVRKRDYWNEELLLAYIDNPRKAKAQMPHLRDSRRAMQAIPRTVPMPARKRLVAHVLQLMDDLK